MEEFGGDEEVLGASSVLIYRTTSLAVVVVTILEGLRLLDHAIEDTARDADHAFVD